MCFDHASNRWLTGLMFAVAVTAGCERSPAGCSESGSCVDAAAVDLEPWDAFPVDLDLTSEPSGADLAGAGPTWSSKAINLNPTCIWGPGPRSVFIGAAPGPEILHSTDEGESWQRVALADARFTCSTMWGIDGEHVFAGGWTSHASIWATANGGASWSEVLEPNYNVNINSISGRSDAVFAVGNNLILRSADQGRTWIATAKPPTSPAFWISVQATREGRTWIASDLGEVAYSDDDGQTWTYDSAFPKAGVSVHLFAAPRRLFALRSIAAPLRVLRSDDGGAKWVDKSGNPLDLNYQFIAGLDDEHVWFGGPDGVLYGTDDGGEIWTQLLPRSNRYGLNGAWAGSPNDVYVISFSDPGPGTIFHYH